MTDLFFQYYSTSEFNHVETQFNSLSGPGKIFKLMYYLAGLFVCPFRIAMFAAAMFRF